MKTQTTQKNFPEIKKKKGVKPHIDRALYVLENINPEWSTPSHILIKLLDFKEKIIWPLDKKSMWLIKEWN